MASIEIDDVTKIFADGTVGLKSVSLSAEEGEMLVLLGPSGCGKSTLLRCLAGLDRPTKGRIRFGQETVFDIQQHVDKRPERRDLGMVFQNYALWPHMNVRENVVFPLKARGMKSAIDEGWAESIVELVSCTPLLNRYPGQLSGGQQQRIALARALVSRPGLILFDEPLSNLDARLRADLRSAIRELHTQLGFTGIYVTHDQEEGLRVADRIAVMNLGEVVSVGAPADVHAAPSNPWVADFLGMTNQLQARLQGENVVFSSLGIDGKSAGAAQDVQVRFRPQDVILSAAPHLIGKEFVQVENVLVKDRAFGGTIVEYMLSVEQQVIRALIPLEAAPPNESCSVGSLVTVGIRRDRLRMFALDGQSLSPEQVRTSIGGN